MSIYRSMEGVEIVELGQPEVCYEWPFGRCRHGVDCMRLHHDNLDPGSAASREDPNYMVPNEVNVACQRCMQAARACDKKGRGGQDDPCSECRWFGGENCRCLTAPTSYNDQLWAVMMTRGNYDYTLPQPKSRDVGKAGNAPPAPMPSHKLKSNWQGETREELMAKSDMLPTFVYDHPRAYLVPPRPSVREKRSAEYKSTLGKRGTESRDEPPAAAAASPSASSLSPFPTGLQFSRPPAHPTYGRVVLTSWSWDLRRWEHTHENGVVVTGPGIFESSGESELTGLAQHTVRGGGEQHTARGGRGGHLLQQHSSRKRQRVQDSSARPENAAPQTARTQIGAEARPSVPVEAKPAVESEVPGENMDDENGSIGYQSSN